MTAYKRGDYREKKAMAALIRNGFECWQARQSRGIVDIVALKGGVKPVLIQVKSGQATIRHYEWNGLYRLAQSLGATPIVVTMDGTKMIWTRILALHSTYGRDWPGEEVFPYALTFRRTRDELPRE